MEKLIIQSGVRQGRFAELTRSQGNFLSVGRGFNNDLVITDSRVAPKQLEFRHDQDHWILHILDNMNPVNVNGKIISDSVIIESGDTVSIGHTKLSVYTENHQVAPTKKLLLSNWLASASIHPIWPIVLLIVSCLLLSVIEYFKSSIDLEWKKYANEALALSIFIIIWAGFWALAGRIFRHQHHMGLQLITTTLVFALSEIVTHLANVAIYPFHSLVLAEYMTWIIFFLTYSILLFFNLALALNLQYPARISALIVSLIFVVSYGYSSFNKTDDFVNYPSFSRKLEPPILGIYYGVSSEDYWSEVSKKAE